MATKQYLKKMERKMKKLLTKLNELYKDKKNDYWVTNPVYQEYVKTKLVYDIATGRNLWGRNAKRPITRTAPSLLEGGYATHRGHNSRIYKILRMEEDGSMLIQYLGLTTSPAKIRRKRWVRSGYGAKTTGWLRPVILTKWAPRWLR